MSKEKNGAAASDVVGGKNVIVPLRLSELSGTPPKERAPVETPAMPTGLAR